MKSLSFIKCTFIGLLAVGFAFPLKAQETKNLHLTNFSGVSVSAGIELHILQGTTEAEKIVASSDFIDEVVVEKSGSTIKVGWKEHWSFSKMWKNKSAKVYITYKKLNSIAASSGSSLRTENTLKTDHLDASVSSGASIEAKIICADLNLEASSGASAALTGAANNLKLEASSGSSVEAVGLATQYARANTSSGADVRLNVSKALETTSSSGSNIRFKGNATLKNNSERRSSDVSRIN